MFVIFVIKKQLRIFLIISIVYSIILDWVENFPVEKNPVENYPLDFFKSLNIQQLKHYYEH